MLLLAILWGLSIPVTKLGLETMPPLVLTLLFVVAFAALRTIPARAAASIQSLQPSSTLPRRSASTAP